MNRFESLHEFPACQATLAGGISNGMACWLNAVEVSVERDEPINKLNQQGLLLVPSTDVQLSIIIHSYKIYDNLNYFICPHTYKLLCLS